MKKFASGALLALLTLALPHAAQALTQVYNIDAAKLVGQAPSCSATVWYNSSACSPAQQPGFTWTDVLAATVTINSVTIKMNNGVDCGSAFSYTTKLNATVGPTYTGATGQCTCGPTEKIVTIAAPAAGYVKGGANTFLTTNPVSCLGNALSAATLGGFYATVTVDYSTAGGPATDPWITPLPGAYPAGQAGNIVGNNLDGKVSLRATQTSVDAVQTAANGIQATANTINANLTAATATLNATKAQVDAIRTKTDATLDGTVTSRASQTSMDAANKKLDDVLKALGDLDSVINRTAIQAALVAAGDNPAKPPHRIAAYVLPTAAGGKLELVRKVVGDGVSQAQAAGFNEALALSDLARGDAAYTAGDWVGAFDWYRTAFKDIF